MKIKDELFLVAIKSWLKCEIEYTELDDRILCQSDDDFIHFGRRECAEGFLKMINEWEKD